MFGIGRAIIAMGGGAKVTRHAWPADEFIVLMPELHQPPYVDGLPTSVELRIAQVIGETRPLLSLPYFALYKGEGYWQPGWVPTAPDMLTEDWYVVRNENAILSGDTHRDGIDHV